MRITGGREVIEKATGRVEAFSDGVFAIAITLLILEIQVPRIAPGASNLALGHGLLALWPSYLAFGGSFSAVLIMWVNHHGFFRLIDGIDARLLYTNGFLLMLIIFLPFSTSVLAAYLNRPGVNCAAAFYCGTYILINIGYNLLWFAAAYRRRLIKAQVSQRTLDRVRTAYQLAFPIYVLATLAALWNAYLGLLVTSSLWVLWARLDYSS